MPHYTITLEASLSPHNLSPLLSHVPPLQAYLSSLVEKGGLEPGMVEVPEGMGGVVEGVRVTDLVEVDEGDGTKVGGGEEGWRVEKE